MTRPVRDWLKAEERLRAADFEGAAQALLARGLGSALEDFFKNTSSHDLMYSAQPRGSRLSERDLRAWKAAAARRASAALWALAGAAELARGGAQRAERTLSRALALEPGLAPALLLRAAARLSLSRRLRDNAGLPGCLDDLDRSLAVAPDDARALRLRAEVRGDCDDDDGARRDLERSLVLAPENGWARAELAEQLCDSGRFEEAWPHIKRLGRGHGQAGWYWALRGRALALGGRAAEGLAALDKAVRLSPRLASALGWRGEARRRLGRLRLALEDFDRSIAMDPGFVYAYEWRARLRLALGRPKPALADAELIVRRDARHRYGPALRGEALFKLGRFREAGAAFDQVFPLHPRFTWSAVIKEGRLALPGENEAAFWEALDEARRRFPASGAVWTLSGRFKAGAGLLGEALAELTQALALARGRAERAEALAWRGRARLDEGSAEAALGDLSDALALRPGDRRSRCWKAEALALSGRSRAALIELGRALSPAGAGPAFGLLARAALRAAAGRWKEARSDYAAAFARDVKSVEARRGAAECRRRLEVW